MSTYRVLQAGPSRSFPEPSPFLSAATPHGAGLVMIGERCGEAYRSLETREGFAFIALELGGECLGVHTGESLATEPSNVVGFARFRLGNAQPTKLIELVRQPNTTPSALAAAKAVFEATDLVTAVCNDFPGRIVNRLIRPFYNSLLRRLDEGLASAQDLDKTLCLGLGYPEGPLALLERTGLEHHYDVTAELHAALAQEAYAPARRAQVARQRASTQPRFSRRFSP